MILHDEVVIAALRVRLFPEGCKQLLVFREQVLPLLDLGVFGRDGRVQLGVRLLAGQRIAQQLLELRILARDGRLQLGLRTDRETTAPTRTRRRCV